MIGVWKHEWIEWEAISTLEYMELVIARGNFPGLFRARVVQRLIRKGPVLPGPSLPSSWNGQTLDHGLTECYAARFNGSGSPTSALARAVTASSASAMPSTFAS